MTWSSDFVRSSKSALIDALKKSMQEQMDAVGKRAGRTFHTTGAGKNTKGGFKYSGKNASGRLRVRSGDLKRAVENRGGKDSNAIREIIIRNNTVTGLIGVDLAYAEIHEYGRFPFLTPSIYKEQPNYYKRFDKYWGKSKI